MYHYNGNEWTEVKLSTDLRGNIKPVIGLYDIHGFSASDIWAVGVDYPSNSRDNSRLVIHFDGTEWRQVDMPPGGWLFAVGGSGPNDIWVGGAYATLLHYDGSSWESYSVPLPASYTSGLFANFSSFAGNSPDDIHAIILNSTEWSYLVGYDGTEWAVEDSFNVTEGNRLWMSPSGTLYSIGSLILSRWDGKNWETLLEDEFLFAGISGTGDDNIFVVGQGFGYIPKIFHYDGIDWYEFPDFDNHEGSLVDVWTDGREVFITGITGFDTTRTIILHGR